MNLYDGVQQLFAFDSFHDVPGSPCRQRRKQPVRLVMHGEHEQFDVGKPHPRRSKKLHSAHARQLQVHQDHVRAQDRYRAQRLLGPIHGANTKETRRGR